MTTLYPAIDLKDGQCVRLLRGEMDAATVFNPDPVDQAQRFEKAGFSWLHLVDLNGAIEGKPVNAQAVEAVLNVAGLPVQLGGGIRSLEQVRFWLERGVARVVLGTVALRDPALVKEACRLFPGAVAVGIDARDGFVAVEGWVETSTVTARELARRFEDAGVAAIIYTDISRDGAMQGPNIDETVALAEGVSMPVILSGGVSSAADVAAVTAAGGGIIEGMIIGRALYDGRIAPADALAAAA